MLRRMLGQLHAFEQCYPDNHRSHLTLSLDFLLVPVVYAKRPVRPLLAAFPQSKYILGKHNLSIYNKKGVDFL